MAEPCDCSKADRIERLEADIRSLKVTIFGNGNDGMKDKLTEVKLSVKTMARVWWIMLGALIANLVGVFFLVLQKLAG